MINKFLKRLYNCVLWEIYFIILKIGELKHLSNYKKIKREIDSIGERIRYRTVLKI